MTFKLRQDAKFHDGTPITAKDVKWSFDRAVTVGGFPTFQMKAGSLEKPEQFVVVDDHTFRVDFIRADKLTMPDIGVPVPVIMNSELCKKHATADRSVGAWNGARTTMPRAAPTRSSAGSRARRSSTRATTTGRTGRCPRSGASSCASSRRPATGAPCSSAATPTCRSTCRRRISPSCKSSPKLTVIGTPIENAMMYLGMNVNQQPFDNVKVRQAVAYAMPYQQIMDAVMFGQAHPAVRRRRQQVQGRRTGRRRTATRPTSPRPRR